MKAYFSKKYINSCTFYIILWALYYLQGTLYASGSIISQSILAVVLLWSVFLTIKVNIEYKLPLFLKVLNIFVITLSLYGIILIMGNEPLYMDNILSSRVSKLDFLKTLYMSLLPIYVMYYYFMRGCLSESFLRAFFLLWLIIVFFSYIRWQREAELKAFQLGKTGDIEVTNNIAYDFLHLFPLLFLWNRKPLFQYLFAAVIFAFIMAGMKRGAILVGAVCLIWFLYKVFVNAKGKGKILILLCTMLLIYVGANYVMNLYETSPYFKYRIEQTLEGNSSNRDVIYSSLWNIYNSDPSLLHFLFGNGACATLKVFGQYAHNDWLELLINQGLLGAVLYAASFATLLYTIYKNKNNKDVYSILAMIFVIMFASSLFSMSYASLGLPIAVGLGYCLNKSTV